RQADHLQTFSYRVQEFGVFQRNSLLLIELLASFRTASPLGQGSIRYREWSWLRRPNRSLRSTRHDLSQKFSNRRQTCVRRHFSFCTRNRQASRIVMSARICSARWHAQHQVTYRTPASAFACVRQTEPPCQRRYRTGCDPHLTPASPYFP